MFFDIYDHRARNIMLFNHGDNFIMEQKFNFTSCAIRNFDFRRCLHPANVPHAFE